MIRFSSIAAVAAAVAACGRDATAPAAQSAISTLTTDSIVYTVPTGTASVVVITRFENKSAAPILLSRCSAGDLRPQVGFQPASADGTPLAAVDVFPEACSGTEALVVEPRSVRIDTLAVEVGPPAYGRLYFAAGQCPDNPVSIGSSVLGCPQFLPDSDRVSNLITVNAAP